jgi:hypothetical protein
MPNLRPPHSSEVGLNITEKPAIANSQVRASEVILEVLEKIKKNYNICYMVKDNGIEFSTDYLLQYGISL